MVCKKKILTNVCFLQSTNAEPHYFPSTNVDLQDESLNRRNSQAILMTLRNTLFDGFSNVYSFIHIFIFFVCMMGWTLYHVITISKKQEKEEEKTGQIEGLPLSILVLAMLMMSLNLLQFFRNHALR